MLTNSHFSKQKDTNPEVLAKQNVAEHAPI